MLSNCRVSNCLFNCPSASNPNIGIIKGTCCQRVNVKMLITLILVQDTNVMKDAGCYNSLDNIRNAIHFNKLESLKSAFQYADCMLICVESLLQSHHGSSFFLYLKFIVYSLHIIWPNHKFLKKVFFGKHLTSFCCGNGMSIQIYKLICN